MTATAIFELEAFQAVQAGEGPTLLRLRVAFHAPIDADVPVLVAAAGDEEHCFAPIPGSVTGEPVPGRTWQGAFGVPRELTGDPETTYALDVGTLVALPAPTPRVLGTPTTRPEEDRQNAAVDAVERERARAERAWEAMRAANRRVTELDRRLNAAEARAEAARERADGLVRQLDSSRSTASRLAALAAEVPRLRRRLDGGEASGEERAEAARRFAALTSRYEQEAARASALAVELEQATGRVDVLVAELERTRAGQLEATSRVQELESRVGELRTLVRERDEELSFLRSAEEAAASDGPEAERDALRARVGQLQSQLADHRATRATFVERLTGTERELEQAQAQVAEMSGEVDRVHAMLEEAQALQHAAEERAEDATTQLHERLGYLKNRLTTVQAREQEERKRRESLEQALRERG